MGESLATEIIVDLERKAQLKADIIKTVLEVDDTDSLQKIYDSITGIENE